MTIPTALLLSDLLALPADPPRYVVAPLIPEHDITLLGGQWASLKTFNAIELAYAIAGGTSYLGRFGVGRAYSVLFIELEMGAQSLRPRCNGMPADLPIRFLVDQRFDLYHEPTFDWLADVEDEVIIIDSAVRLFRGKEADAQDVAAFFARLFDLKQRGKTIILLHHTRNSVRAKAPPTPRR